jgi:hypothetical protein
MASGCGLQQKEMILYDRLFGSCQAVFVAILEAPLSCFHTLGEKELTPEELSPSQGEINRE